MSVAAALLTLAVALTFKRTAGREPTCRLTITGHTISLSGCDLSKVPDIVKSFAWSGHGLRHR